MAEPKSDNTNM